MVAYNRINKETDSGFVMCEKKQDMKEEDDEQTEWSKRTGIVRMSWDENTRHTVPLGTTWKEFQRTWVMYASYWTLHESRPYNHICGSGRPFAPVCLNGKCGQQLEKMTMIVQVEEAKMHANTPLLGSCACICCRRCVTGMPVKDKLWRECPGCGYEYSHRDTYLRYPLTWEGEKFNIQLGKEIQKKHRQRKRKND